MRILIYLIGISTGIDKKVKKNIFFRHILSNLAIEIFSNSTKTKKTSPWRTKTKILFIPWYLWPLLGGGIRVFNK